MDAIGQVIACAGNEERRILSLLQQRGPLTKNDLIAALQTNFTSLNRLMRPLEEARLIAGVGSGTSTGGRKPILYDLNAKSFYVFGIDISRSHTQVVAVDPKMRILFKRAFPMDETCTPDRTVHTIARLFEEALAEIGAARESFLGAGLGAVGPLDRRSGAMLRPVSFAAPGWNGIDIRGMLEAGIGLTVEIDNGANTAVLAEYKLGVGRGRSHVAYFNCSYGIRTGVISEGQIVRGQCDAEDAFGHMVIDVDGAPCSCGNYGCVDCYATIQAIIKRYVSAVKSGRAAGVAKPIESISYIDICRTAAEGDALAREVIINAATFLGVGLANYINLFHPELVILNGPLVNYSDLYYETCIRTAANRLYAKDPDRIAFSKGGAFADDAIALGAALMAAESHLACR